MRQGGRERGPLPEGTKYLDLNLVRRDPGDVCVLIVRRTYLFNIRLIPYLSFWLFVLYLYGSLVFILCIFICEFHSRLTSYFECSIMSA